jgi:hypothetical protein
MSYVPLQEIGAMKSLRTLGLAAVKDFGQVGRTKNYSFCSKLIREPILKGNTEYR